jgi:protocatechuate 3,4-dioxygenase beta subunit
MVKLTSILMATALVAVLNPAWQTAAEPPVSGLHPGEQVEPWNPLHVAGPDQGTNICPVCTYLEKPVVVVFAKDTSNTAELLARLEALAHVYRKAGLRVVVAITDASPERVKALATTTGITDASLCYLSEKSGAKELQAYRIDAKAENTAMVYKDYTVTASFVNLPAKDSDRLTDAVKKLIP